MYVFKFRARMWAWDRYGPQMKKYCSGCLVC